MIYGDNEGPTQTTIPQQSFTTCSGCKYFSRSLWRSGRDPVYHNNCEHPELRDTLRKFGNNLHENHLGIVETPGWCPILNKKEKE
jgi:hypothetical protein